MKRNSCVRWHLNWDLDDLFKIQRANGDEKSRFSPLDLLICCLLIDVDGVWHKLITPLFDTLRVEIDLCTLFPHFNLYGYVICKLNNTRIYCFILRDS